MGSSPPDSPIRVGVLLFPGHEPLDWVAPVNIWGAVKDADGRPRIEMLYIAENAGPVTSVTGTVSVIASYSFADLPPPAASPQHSPSANGRPATPPSPPSHQQLHWLLVPGGIGTRREAANPALLEYIRAWAAPSSGLQLCMSVCTGAALLAAAGALDGRRATSNKRAFDWVKSVNPRVDWVRSARWVRDGNFVTSSGVSAGADMAVHVLKEVLGAEVAAKAAQYAEYIPATDADKDPFADEAFLPAV